ncbi:MAG: exonuclease domain-containing protein [Dolichospermum sp.]|jgi:DNA polymerase-3 subunit epsilon
MIKYDYWGGSNPPPDNLKTTKQLAELGLKGVKTVAFIEARKYTIGLYDINDTNSVKSKRQATFKQLEALEKARKEARKKAWVKKWGWIDKYRIEAVLKSRELLGTPDSWVILDTETTGLYNCEVIEIAVIDGHKNILLNTRIKPTIPIEYEAYQVHGISDNDLIYAPSFNVIYPRLKAAIKDKLVLIYNEDFDRNAIAHCCKIRSLPLLQYQTSCMMYLYAGWYGCYSEYWNDFQWQKLPGGDHTALGDCLAVWDILQTMANDSDQPKYPDFEDAPKADNQDNNDDEIPF